ncbi:MAG: type I methionyl aminopeptidase [Candidatus Kapabacteria bacterium]|nr:type I methionyl aminopeptidase [Candidatus Kapabacteria bacterium]
MDIHDTPVALHSKSEIGFMAESCELVSRTIELVGKHIKPGITTLELDEIAEEFIRSNGAEPAFKGYGGHGSVKPFPYTLCISIDNEVVHGMPRHRTLEVGQIVSIDCGVKKNGFFGDSAFTFPVGVVSEQKQKLLRITRESLDAGVAQAVTGNTNYDIAKAVQQHVERNGFSVVRDLVGHGVGEELHQDPCVPNFVPGLLYKNRYPKTKLTQGMTIAIEPMVNTGTFQVHTASDGWTIVTNDGKPAAHFEHTVVVEAGKPVVLTYFPDQTTTM